MSRRWTYVEPDGDNGSRFVTMTEEQILAEYYPHWCTEMKKAGKESEISPSACLEDWIVVHWAEEQHDPSGFRD